MYEVISLGIILGTIRYDPDAWSAGRWMIDGDRNEYCTSASANGVQRKKMGCKTLEAAVKRVATMKSGVIIGEVCRRNL